MSNGKQRKFYEERLRQLRQLGYASPYEQGLTNSQPFEALVEQCAPPGECRIYDLGDQGTLYMVWLSVIAERPGVCLYDFRFIPPWPDNAFQALGSKDGCPRNVYVLPNDASFPRETILNWRFGASGWRLPLTPVEGWLCGHSLTPIPKEYEYGAEVDIRIEFFGKFGRRLAQTDSTLWVDRSIEFDRVAHCAASEHATAESASQPEQSYVDYLRSLPEERRLSRSGLFAPESIEDYLRSLSTTGEGDHGATPNTSRKEGRTVNYDSAPKFEKP